MIAHMQSIGGEGSGKRRAHKKSRQGCRNCKLRRVKCDETRPKCTQCITFRVSCNYDSKAPDLQTSFDGIARDLQDPMQSVDHTLPCTMKTPAYQYWPMTPGNHLISQLDRECWERLGRFQMRTVLSIGPPDISHIYQKETLKLAWAHPYLMHVIQTITAIHDRYLYSSPKSRQTITEAYHWSRAATLFNQKLSAPVESFDRDAVWATAVLLCSTLFSSVEASDPEEAWPLKRPESSDLEWLRMLCGKMVIWDLTDPLRPDSAFHALADIHASWDLSSTGSELESIPPAFIQLCGLENPSTACNNPYRAPMRALAPLLHIECNQSTVPNFLSFICGLQPDFKRLLEQKDPRALLVLAYWYAKICQSLWWTVRRANLECQATCLYLERYHPSETAIQEMLYYPKMRCGLVA